MSTTPKGNLWLRVHIDFMDHPKFIDLDSDSIVLWLSAMSYSKRFLTDGVVPVAKIRSLSGAKRWKKCVENLVNRDIFHWDFDQKNIIIHDFSTWQESKEEVDARREKWRLNWEKRQANKVSAGSEHQFSAVDSTVESTETPRTRVQRQSTETETEINTFAADSVDCEGGARNSALIESVMSVCKISKHGITSSARAGLNSVVKQLRDAGASPGEVEVRAEIFRQMYPNAQLTPMALAKHWPALTAEALPVHEMDEAIKKFIEEHPEFDEEAGDE